MASGQFAIKHRKKGVDFIYEYACLPTKKTDGGGSSLNEKGDLEMGSIELGIVKSDQICARIWPPGL